MKERSTLRRLRECESFCKLLERTKLILEDSLTLTKTKTHVKIARRDWEKMKTNPALSEAIELLEDIADLEKAKKVKGKSLTIEQYRKKRGLHSSH